MQNKAKNYAKKGYLLNVNVTDDDLKVDFKNLQRRNERRQASPEIVTDY